METQFSKNINDTISSVDRSNAKTRGYNYP